MLEARFFLIILLLGLLSLVTLGVAAPASSSLPGTKQASVEEELERLKNIHQGVEAAIQKPAGEQARKDQPAPLDHSSRQGQEQDVPRQERMGPHREPPNSGIPHQASPTEDQLPRGGIDLQRQFYNGDRENAGKRWPIVPPEQAGGYYYEMANEPAAVRGGGDRGGDYLPVEEDVAYNIRDLLRQGMIERQDPSLFFPGSVVPGGNRQLRLLDSPEEVRDEGTLEEIIYQLARDMFTQNLLRGEPSAEETFSKLASFLETEVSFGRISREMEQKIMSIVTGALVDTLRDFPELLPEQPPRKRDPSLAQLPAETPSLKTEQHSQPKKVWNKEETARANSTTTAA